MMQVIRAEKMGFCFGVKEAIETCYKYINDIKEGKRIYILGMLVHNEHVTQEMENLGFLKISEEDILEEKVELTENDIVIIRAHGTKKRIYEKLKEKNVIIEDGACIFVKNIREKLLQLVKIGNTIIFLGDKNHPEVEGIISFTENVLTVKNLEELKKLKIDSEKKYALLTQTTLNKENIQEIKKYLENTHLNVTIFNKICGATSERQDAVRKLAQEVELVLIVGDKKSSNTQKLFEVSSKINHNTKLISDSIDLDKQWFQGLKKIGITAGASTPDKIISKIENIIKEEF
ncbi:MAG: 4-hydroxy-3-methylbut-2-enyl diphosphate reductase [Fusobacteriaceae bacterium]